MGEKSLTIQLTIITRKNDRLQRKFRISGLRSKIVNYINKKCRYRLQITKQVLQVKRK